MNYDQFLEGKIKVAERKGITIDRRELHHSSKPHQLDIIEWALEMGSGLIAADTGMGKSHIGIEVMRMVQLFRRKCTAIRSGMTTPCYKLSAWPCSRISSLERAQAARQEGVRIN